MKSKIRYLLALLYLMAIMACLLMVVKPGASIFYIKQSIDNQALVRDTGFAYRYRLKVNPLFYRPRGILLFEDGQALIPSQDDLVVNTGKSTYSLSKMSQGAYYLFLSSSDNSDPITNGRKYTLYLPISIISRQKGIVYLIILLPGLVWFLFFAFVVPDNRRTLFHSFKGILIVIDRFFEHISQTIRPDIGTAGQQIKTRPIVWKKLFTITILLTYFYVLMEWIFYITKPSFMRMMSAMEQVEIFILSGLFFALLSMVAIAAYIIIDIFFLIIHRSIITRYLVAVIPTIILSILILLMIDNFIYTIFKFGISTSAGIGRGVYGLLFIFLFIYVYLRMLRFFGLERKTTSTGKLSNLLFYLVVGILIISTGLALTSLDFSKLTPAGAVTEAQQAARYPNIILLGSDGVNADNMSVYGYDRDTTPRMRDLAQSALVAENAFTNSSNTGGSIISIFTSKLPTQTRVLYAPDILTGTDVYQHIPALLKLEGYTTVEFGVPNYVDAFSFNAQYSFDTVNGRTQGFGKISTFARILGFDKIIYFLYNLATRVYDRIQHIFFIRDMQNPYSIVTQPVSGMSDEEKITQMLDVIEQSPNPVFVHVHLMGTHGAIFDPPIRVYSKGEPQDQEWMVDFYDDTILSFDHYVGEVIDRLKADGEYENTLLIIYSDHGIKYRVTERVPLIMHFPADNYAGRITQNVQNLDIAPTILDYMGLTVPVWMNGMSILNGKLDSHRLIFSAGTAKTLETQKGIFTLDPTQVKPPFYQFSIFNVVDCQRWYYLDLSTLKWISGDIQGYTSPCSEDSLLSFNEIKNALSQQLTTNGFDTSSLP